MTDSVALQHRRLQRANVAIMREPRFALWSGFLTMGSVSVLPDTFTARTDGVNEEYSAPFLESLTDKEIVFVRLHEMLHKAFKHPYTGQVNESTSRGWNAIPSRVDEQGVGK